MKGRRLGMRMLTLQRHQNNKMRDEMFGNVWNEDLTELIGMWRKTKGGEYHVRGRSVFLLKVLKSFVSVSSETCCVSRG